MPSFLRQLLLRLGILSPESKGHPARNSRASTKLGEANGQASSFFAGDLPSELSNDLPNDLQREIRAERKFSLAEAIGRESAGFMKGESAIPRPLRATNAIKQFITANLAEPTSALSTTLQSWVTEDIRVSRHLDTPLVALTQILEGTLAEPTTFCEFARQVAIAHANITGNRPHFQQPNSAPHPDAHYTHRTIELELCGLLESLNKRTHNSLDIANP